MSLLSFDLCSDVNREAQVIIEVGFLTDFSSFEK